MPTPVTVYPNTYNEQAGCVSNTPLISSLAIRDTSSHDPSTDTPGTSTFLANCTYATGTRILYVNNGLNQNVTVTVVTSVDGGILLSVGSGVVVNASTSQYIDGSAYYQLENPYLYVGVRVVAASPPTTGVLSVSLLSANQGGAITNVGSVSLGTTTITGGLPAGTNTIGSVKLDDGTGNTLTSISDGFGNTGLATSLNTTYFGISTGNSTTAQLATTATFTGAREQIVYQQTISVIMTSDQNGTLTLNQYIDAAGTRKVSSWVYAIVGGTPFSRSFTANGNYFNLTYQNTSASTTTTLNINVAYGTLFPATNMGNVPIAANEVNGSSLSLGQTTMAGSLPVVVSSDQSSVPVSLNKISGVATPGYFLPPAIGLTTVTASATGLANTSNAVSLPAVSSLINYVTGFEVTAIPATSVGSGVVTLTGTTSGTLSYQFYVPTTSVAPEQGKLLVEFPMPIPASALNTAITLTCPALGSGSGATAVVIHGFVQ